MHRSDFRGGGVAAASLWRGDVSVGTDAKRTLLGHATTHAARAKSVRILAEVSSSSVVDTLIVSSMARCYAGGGDRTLMSDEAHSVLSAACIPFHHSGDSEFIARFRASSRRSLNIP